MHAQNRGKGEGGCKQQLWALQPALPFDQDEFNFFLVKFSGNFHKMLRRLLSNPAAEESGEEQKEYVLLSKMQPGPADPFNSFPAAFPAYDGHGQPSVCWPHQQLPMDAAPLLPSLALTESDFYWPNFIPPPADNPQFDPLLGPSMAPFPAILQPVPATQQQQPIIANPAPSLLLDTKGPMAIDGVPSAFTANQVEPESVGQGDKPESPDTQEESVCPYCHKQSRGSIRRHMAQCRRLKGIPKEEAAPARPLKRPKTPASGNAIGVVAEKKHRASPGMATQSAQTVDPANPYLCVWCQFSTLYKGNMKRHLVCCHQVSAELLQQMNFNVERLRKFAEDRPALGELPIQRRKDNREKHSLSVEEALPTTDEECSSSNSALSCC